MNRSFFKILRLFLVFCFSLQGVIAPEYLHAQTVSAVPPIIGSPVLLKGIILNSDDPFALTFLIDSGQMDLPQHLVRSETDKLIQYFLAGLTIPEQNLWVNLSPDEKNRVIPENFGKTLAGVDLLGQDVTLKKMTASLMASDSAIGKVFWERYYQLMWEKYGVMDSDIEMFHRVWIVPDYANIYEQENSAYIGDCHLKVMLEEDYLRGVRNQGSGVRNQELGVNSVKTASVELQDLIRKDIIPQLEQEVNEGESFQILRQVFNAILLATWFKSCLKESVLYRSYSDRELVRGIEQQSHLNPEKIYQQYLDVFSNGMNKNISEVYDPQTQKIIPKQFLSGGAQWKSDAMLVNKAQLRELKFSGQAFAVDVDLKKTGYESGVSFSDQFDAAMMASDKKAYKEWRRVEPSEITQVRQTVFYVDNGLEHVAKIIKIEKDSFTISVQAYLSRRPSEILIYKKELRQEELYWLPKSVIVEEDLLLNHGSILKGFQYAMMIWRDYKEEFDQLRMHGVSTLNAAMPIVKERSVYGAIRSLLKYGYIEKKEIEESDLNNFLSMITKIKRISSMERRFETNEFLDAVEWLQKRSWDEYFMVRVLIPSLSESEHALLRSGWFLNQVEFKNKVISFRKNWERHIGNLQFYDEIFEDTNAVYAEWMKRNTSVIVTPLMGIFDEIDSNFKEEDLMYSVYLSQSWLVKDKMRSLLFISGADVRQVIPVNERFIPILRSQINYFVSMGHDVYNFGLVTSPYIYAMNAFNEADFNKVKDVFQKHFGDDFQFTNRQISKSFGEGEYHNFEAISLAVKHELKKMNLNNDVHVNLSDKRLVVSLINKLTSLMAHMRINTNLKWDNITAFGSSGLDISYLNYVANKGGVAIWLGGKDHPAIQNGKLSSLVHIAPHKKNQGFIRSLHAFLKENDSAMMSDVLPEEQTPTGGVDLSASRSTMNVHKNESGVRLGFDRQPLDKSISGLIPVIKSFMPMTPQAAELLFKSSLKNP